MKMIYWLSVWAVFMLASCSGGAPPDDERATMETTPAVEAEVDPMQSIGVGEIKKVTLGEEIDVEMAAAGQVVYEQMCTACHIPDENFIGPAPIGILERRTPEWIMNMILDPELMVEKDPTAKKLLKEFNGTLMANQNLTEEQARQILEYFRTL